MRRTRAPPRQQAVVLACSLARETPLRGLREARRLLDTIGWAFVLPQLLGTPGLVFSEAGVGKAVAWVTTHDIATDIRPMAVAVHVVGMALFTVVMGNGLAAFGQEWRDPRTMAHGPGHPGRQHRPAVLLAALSLRPHP